MQSYYLVLQIVLVVLSKDYIMKSRYNKFCINEHLNLNTAKYCRVCGKNKFIKEKTFVSSLKEFFYPKLKSIKSKLGSFLGDFAAPILVVTIGITVIAVPAYFGLKFKNSNMGEQPEYNSLIKDLEKISFEERDDYIVKMLPSVKAKPTDKDIEDLIVYCPYEQRASVLSALRNKKMAN